MIIGKDYVIAHFPKTGGHAMQEMFKNSNENVKYIFGKQKHITFKHYHESYGPKDITGKRLFIVIRRLPQWFLSFMWHQSKHSEIRNNKVQKLSRGVPYTTPGKQAQGYLTNADIMCQCNYPDTKLFKHFDYDADITVLRQERLVRDLNKFVGLKLKDVPKSTFSYSSDKPVSYWHPHQLNNLYSSNPFWSGIEEEVYGSLIKNKA